MKKTILFNNKIPSVPETEEEHAQAFLQVLVTGDICALKQFLDRYTALYFTRFNKSLLSLTYTHYSKQSPHMIAWSSFPLEGWDKYEGYNALMVAIIYDYAKIAQELISRGINIDYMNNDNLQAIEVAVYFGSVNTLNVLLKNGANVNFLDRNGCSLLCLIAGDEIGISGSQKLAIAKVLIHHGIDVNLTNYWLSPLGEAVYCGWREMAELLIENGADADGAELKQCVEKAPELLELFLKTRPSDHSKNEALSYAAYYRDLASVELLIEYGTDVYNIDINDGAFDPDAYEDDSERISNAFGELLETQDYELAKVLLLGFRYEVPITLDVYEEEAKQANVSYMQIDRFITQSMQSAFITSAYNKYLNKVFLATFIEECKTYKAIMLVANRLGRIDKPLPPILPSLMWRMICEYASRYSFKVTDDSIEKYDHVQNQRMEIVALNPRVTEGIKVQKPQNKVCSVQMKVEPTRLARG